MDAASLKPRRGFPVGAERLRRVGNALLVLLALLVLMSVYGLVLRLGQSVEEERRLVVEEGRRLVAQIDHEVDIHLYNLMAMDLLAQRFLRGSRQGQDVPDLHFKPVPGKDVYVAELELGRISGRGAAPAAKAPVRREMAMAESLTPMMQAIRARTPDTPWIYYVSARQFVYMFPGGEGSDFLYPPELQSMEFFARATPRANPDRKAFLTHPYVDAAGKGLMVTASHPLYVDDRFLGVLSIDISIRSIQRLLDENPVAHASISLLSDEGQSIASMRATQEPAGAHREESISLDLSTAPWRVSMQVNRGQLIEAAVKKRSAHILSVLVLAFSYLFLLVLVRSNRRIRELSLRDSLTGLYNRRYFDEAVPARLDAARRGAARVGFAILDVDFFKKYNDTYGHQQGDVALKAIAQALRGALRRGSDQVFRVGGEEFAIVVSLGRDEPFEPVTAAINQAVRDLQLPHAQNGPGIVTVSIGATVVDRQQAADLDLAYRTADAALYQAKEGGRDRCVFLSFSP